MTVAMICEEAAFSRDLIGHFKGKDDLLLDTIQCMSSELAEANRSAAKAAGKDPIERLHAAVLRLMGRTNDAEGGVDEPARCLGGPRPLARGTELPGGLLLLANRRLDRVTVWAGESEPAGT